MLKKEENIAELLSAIKKLNDAINTVESSNFIVETPEGALLKFLLQNYDDSNVSNLAEMLAETLQNEKQQEITQPTPTQIVKRKSLVNGSRIKGTLAKSVEKIYRTPLIKERYARVKKVISQQPNREVDIDKLKSLTGYSINSLVAHLRYGVELSEIVLDKKTKIYKILGVRQVHLDLPEPKRSYVKKSTETLLTDPAAKEITKKYQIIVSAERYNKVMHVLSTHINQKASVSELQKLATNVPKSAVYPLMRYGVLKGDVVSLSKDTFMTKANFDRSKEKNVKVESKSFIKEDKQKKMFDENGKLIIDKEREH